MALTPERIGQVAMLFLQRKLEDDGGLRLRPKEVRREIINVSKRLGITPQESAELAKVILKTAYDKTVAELDAILKTDKVEE